MPEPIDQPAKPPRTWRPMILWTAGILLVLGLVWFVGTVVVPVWQVRRMLGEDLPSMSGEVIVQRLGGEVAAARKLALYRRLPSWLAPSPQRFEIDLFGYCGQAGAPYLTDIIQKEMGGPRLCALKAFANRVRAPREAASVLALALDEDWEPAHFYSLIALERMGPLAEDALPAIERELWATGEAARPDAAATALWAINHERLLAFLRDPDINKRCLAVEHLDTVARCSRDPRALAGLRAAAASDDPAVRTAAAEALKKIGDDSTGN